jgi:hypothetical protein
MSIEFKVDSGGKEVQKAKSAEARLGRMLINFRVFISNLEHVAAAIKTCSEAASKVLENYEGTSRSVPLTLRPLVENLDLVEERISQGVFDMRAEESRFSVEAVNADGRGSWRMVLRILLRIVGECTVQLSRLPVIPKSETSRQNISRRYTQSHVLPVLQANTEHLTVLVHIFPTLMMITLHPGAVNETEAKVLLASFYTHPFWYNVRHSSIHKSPKQEHSSLVPLEAQLKSLHKVLQVASSLFSTYP